MSFLKQIAAIFNGINLGTHGRPHSPERNSRSFERGWRRPGGALVFDVAFPTFLLLAAIVLQYTSLDVWIASHFYDSVSASWPYKHTWLTESVIHDGGRLAAIFLGTVPFIGFVMSFFFRALRQHRRVTCYLALATALGPLLVSALKSVTHMYSPWDLALFGGNFELIRMLDAVPPGAPVGHAFPAGHASAGFAFVSVFFLLRERSPRYRHHALAIAIVIGGIFGIDQQVRGAHMLSHDLVALAICWMSGAIMVSLILRPSRRKSPMTVPLNSEPDLKVARIRESEQIDYHNASR